MVGTWKFEIGDIIKESNIASYSYRYHNNIYIVDGYYGAKNGGRYYVTVSTDGHVAIQDKTSIEANHSLIGKSECPKMKTEPVKETQLYGQLSAYGMCK